MSATLFRRGVALEVLEDYAAVVVLHLALIEHFPDSRDKNHWKKELRAFAKVYARYNKGKKGRNNFTRDMVINILTDFLEDADDRGSLVATIRAKGLHLNEDETRLEVIQKAIASFADQVFNPE